MLAISKPAPSFTLPAYTKSGFTDVSLDDYKGKWVVLFFYPRDFTFVCPTEIKGFAKHQLKFGKEGAEILACSTDSVYSHKAWFSADMPEVEFPVLADTAHHMTRDYGVLNEHDGTAERGTFIIDPEGVLRYIVISDSNVGRSVGETLRVLQALKTGGLCPIDWEPGQDTLKG